MGSGRAIASKRAADFGEGQAASDMGQIHRALAREATGARQRVGACNSPIGTMKAAATAASMTSA